VIQGLVDASKADSTVTTISDSGSHIPMPTITHYVLDPFLETGSLPNLQKVVTKPPPAAQSPLEKSSEKPIPVPAALDRTHTLPALYTTPESTPLPDSPSSFPGTWSPYVINHKRRGPGLIKTSSQGDVGSEGSLPKSPVALPALPKRSEAFQVQESEFRSDGVVGGNNGVEETLDGQNEGAQKGKVTLFGQDEQDQPEFEFRHGSPDALVRPVNVGRLVNNGMPRMAKVMPSLNFRIHKV